MWKDTSSSATSPPKRSVRLSTSRTFFTFVVSGTGALLVVDLALFERHDLLLQLLRPHGTPRWQQPLGTEDGEHHQRKAGDQDSELGEVAEPLREVGDEERADQDAP